MGYDFIGPSMVDVGEHIPPIFGTRKWWYFNIQGFRGWRKLCHDQNG
jgi:hypothetical protein